jgi:hypothetical protein
VTITSRGLRLLAAMTEPPVNWQAIFLEAAQDIEELEMELVCRPAKVEVTKCDLKANFMDFYATHPKLDYKSSQKEEWEAVYRHAAADMEAAYNDGQYGLHAIQSWRSADPAEREKAKRKALFLEALRRWGFAAGIEQARDWWELLKTRGRVQGMLEDMVAAVNWIGRTSSSRGVSVTFANQAVGLIDEYRQGRQ